MSRLLKVSSAVAALIAAACAGDADMTQPRAGSVFPSVLSTAELNLAPGVSFGENIDTLALFQFLSHVPPSHRHKVAELLADPNKSGFSLRGAPPEVESDFAKVFRKRPAP